MTYSFSVFHMLEAPSPACLLVTRICICGQTEHVCRLIGISQAPVGGREASKGIGVGGSSASVLGRRESMDTWYSQHFESQQGFENFSKAGIFVLCSHCKKQLNVSEVLRSNIASSQGGIEGKQPSHDLHSAADAETQLYFLPGM